MSRTEDCPPNSLRILRRLPNGLIEARLHHRNSTADQLHNSKHCVEHLREEMKDGRVSPHRSDTGAGCNCMCHDSEVAL